MAKQPAPTPTAPARPPARVRRVPFVLLALLIFAAVVYHGVLAPGHVLFTTDDNIGALAMRKASLPGAFLGGWDDSIALGQPVFTHFTWTNILLYILPLKLFTNWIHAIDLIVGSLALAGWLRLRGFSRGAQMIAALTAFWVGSTFFLTYAGHIGKFGVVMFAGLYLYLVERAILQRSWAWAVLAGGAMGGMFLEQADVGLFFALPLGAYSVWGMIRERGFRLADMICVPAVVAIVAGALAFHPVWMARSLFSLEKKDSAPAAEQDAQANWEYCTQWSWPPDETIEFVVPGYMGWRSGEPAGPYWGRMGRSAGWEQTRQGFQNFRLETLYLGAIPVWLGLLGLALTFRKGLARRGDLVFWSTVTVVTFLLALGKFFPLYRLFYALPGMSSIRNPVKFMQVFQFGLAFLAASGFDALQGHRDGAQARVGRWAVWSIAGTGLLFALWAMTLGGSTSALVSRFAQEGWGQYASVIARNIANGLGHAALICLLAAGAGFLLSRGGNAPSARWAGTALLLIAAIDQLIVSRLYVQTMRAEGFFAENAVTRQLKQQLGAQRTYLLTQESFYNLWLTYLFPYHDIPSLNITQMRMPDDYKQFFSATQREPLRLWQMAAVGAVIGPMDAARQLAGAEATRGLFQPLQGFNAGQAPGGGVAIQQMPDLKSAQHVLLKYLAPAPRFQLIGAWRVLEDEAVLKELERADRPLFEVALLNKDAADSLVDNVDKPGSAGSVAIVAHRPGFARLRVTADRPCILRVADKYERGWRCDMGGTALPVTRCDHVCIGVPVPAGSHELTLAYKPEVKSLYAEMAGLGLCALAGLALLLGRGSRQQIADPA